MLVRRDSLLERWIPLWLQVVMSHAIKTVPDSVLGGVHKIFTKPGQRHDLKEDARQLYADIDLEEDDNIPPRILLLLMDEIFDLKHKNLWLKR